MDNCTDGAGKAGVVRQTLQAVSTRLHPGPQRDEDGIAIYRINVVEETPAEVGPEGASVGSFFGHDPELKVFVPELTLQGVRVMRGQTACRLSTGLPGTIQAPENGILACCCRTSWRTPSGTKC